MVFESTDRRRPSLAGETEIRAAGGCFLIARTSWVYAARGNNFVRIIVRLARERKELRVVADQIGAPTSAALIAGAIADMIPGDLATLRERCAQAHGVVHLAACRETSRHGFASAIVAGLRVRGVPLAVERVIPIRTHEYPSRAERPLNSRLDLARLRQVFGMTPAQCETALATELDEVAHELFAAPNAPT